MPDRYQFPFDGQSHTGWATAWGGDGVHVSGGHKLHVNGNKRMYLVSDYRDGRHGYDDGAWTGLSYYRPQLLGKELSFTVDLSDVGCMVDGTLYLTRMTDPDARGANYCGIGTKHTHLGNDDNGTEIVCTEIDLMESNVKAYHSALHTEQARHAPRCTRSHRATRHARAPALRSGLQLAPCVCSRTGPRVQRRVQQLRRGGQLGPRGAHRFGQVGRRAVRPQRQRGHRHVASVHGARRILGGRDA